MLAFIFHQVTYNTITACKKHLNNSYWLLFTYTFQHCRKCGRIFCDRCSSFRALLDPAETVQDPGNSDSASSSSSTQRVCQGCHDEVTGSIPDGLRGLGATTMERVFVDQEQLTIPGNLSRQRSSSQLSDLAECVLIQTPYID